MGVESDLIVGSRLNDNLESGITVVRKFLVDDVTGAKETRPFNALTTANIPALFDAHPTIFGLYCTNREVEPASEDSNKKFFVTCTYTQVGPSLSPTGNSQALMSVGGTVQTEQTTFDKDGNIIFVLNPDTTLTSQERRQTGLVEKQIPQFTLSFTRKEEVNPINKAKKYVGKINKVRFEDLDERSVLCTRIAGSSNDGGKTFDVTYEFQVKLDLWVTEVVFVDTSTGLPDKDATIENGGIQAYQLYEEIDFNQLDLTE